MDILILDKSYNALSVCDSFISAIWTDRYIGYGDFEIYAPVEVQYRPDIVLGNYVWQRDSDRIMIIEEFSIKSDPENGNTLTVKGRSLESILDRRVIWGYKTVTGNFQEAIKTLITEAIISPTNANRKIENFTFKDSKDEAITSLTIDSTEYFGENLYDAIVNLCTLKGVGFRILPDYDTGGFIFELYAGKNRTWDEFEAAPVLFSYKYENLRESNYVENNAGLKTAALVAGNGTGEERTVNEVLNDAGGGTGLDRREVFVSSSGDEITTEGKEAIAETETITAFEGEIETQSNQFVYNRDFFIGDIVEVLNEYGNQCQCRISELVRTSDEDEDSLYPTFTSTTSSEVESNGN